MVTSSERVIRLDIANSVCGNDLLIVSVNVFLKPFGLLRLLCDFNPRIILWAVLIYLSIIILLYYFYHSNKN